MFKKYFQLKVFFHHRGHRVPQRLYFNVHHGLQRKTQIKFKIPRGEGKYLRLPSFQKEGSQIT